MTVGGVQNKCTLRSELRFSDLLNKSHVIILKTNLPLEVHPKAIKGNFGKYILKPKKGSSGSTS